MANPIYWRFYHHGPSEAVENTRAKINDSGAERQTEALGADKSTSSYPTR